MHKTEVRICGLVVKEKVFTLEQLLTLDKVETGEMLFACGSGEPKGRIPCCRGVLLTDLINESEVVTREHNDTKKMYVVAASDDGYKTVFSWQELFNTEVGEGVMIILEKDGHSLVEEKGAVDLFSARDFLLGPRYVKRLQTITLIKLEE